MTLVGELLADTPYEAVVGDRSLHYDGDPSDVAAVFIRSRTKIDETIKTKFPNVRAIIRAGVGLDNVDVDFCRAEEITIHNAPRANSDAVAEYVVAMLLFTMRRLRTLKREDVRQWNRFAYVGESMSGQTVGIVGFGNVGRLVQQKLAGLGCSRFVVYDPFLPAGAVQGEGIEQVDELEQLLERSTMITLHMPLTDETRHMIGASQLARLQDGVILVNAARGGIVDELALLKILDDTSLTYVADTVENEPEVRPELLGREDIIVTPHMAGLTHEAERNIVVHALQSFLES